jgi:hypothetical protein
MEFEKIETKKEVELWDKMIKNIVMGYLVLARLLR